MPATAIVNTKLTGYNKFGKVGAVAAVDVTSGALITADVADQKLLLVAENTDQTTEQTVTVKKGDGLQGTTDLALVIPIGEIHCVVLESMKYKNMTGTNKGKIIVTGSAATIKVAVTTLP